VGKRGGEKGKAAKNQLGKGEEKDNLWGKMILVRGGLDENAGLLFDKKESAISKNRTFLFRKRGGGGGGRRRPKEGKAFLRRRKGASLRQGAGGEEKEEKKRMKRGGRHL